jgi:hypothetical protein
VRLADIGFGTQFLGLRDTSLTRFRSIFKNTQENRNKGDRYNGLHPDG